MFHELFLPFGNTLEVPEELDDDLAYTMSSDTKYRFDQDKEKDFSQFTYMSST